MWSLPSKDYVARKSATYHGVRRKAKDPHVWALNSKDYVLEMPYIKLKILFQKFSHHQRFNRKN